MAVKIIIKRRVPSDKEARLSPLLTQLRAGAITQPGYISGETMRNVDDPEEYLVISTWNSVDSWKKWASSPQRKKLQETIDALLGSQTEYGVYFYGE